uniref:Putative LAGLIDADG homing endonuclease n=1 Tax=Caulerpa ashmeadii TaxID=177078 RepID=A0A6B9VYW1_9CHLO|nr:putative LAGLIDADG homing endonuclease [Caulerpa ashmeadii]QHQ73269.1 putative LAGLIDADG homing endonuclease [Caulerpa ashmeadii]
MPLTQLQKDLIFGSLLGDGNLQTSSNGRTWRYRAIQKSEHKEYLFNKYEILKNLCGATVVPKENEILDRRTNKFIKRWSFNTLTNTSLKFFGNMFYSYDSNKQRWTKKVPLKIKTFLNPRALAYFYMDDGALKWLGHSNAMRICTENFSLEDIYRIKNALKNLYNIDINLTKKKLKNGEIRFRILIPERSSNYFRELIKPYLIECMKYKVSDGNYGHL